MTLSESLSAGRVGDSENTVDRRLPKSPSVLHIQGSPSSAFDFEKRETDEYTRVAFQSTSKQEFLTRMRKAINYCEKSALECRDASAGMSKRQREGNSLLFKAKGQLMRSWLANGYDAQRKLEGSSIKSLEKAIKIFEVLGDDIGLTECYNLLLSCLAQKLANQKDAKTCLALVNYALASSQRSIEILSKYPNKRKELCFAYLSGVTFAAFGDNFSEKDEERRQFKRIGESLQNAASAKFRELGDQLMIPEIGNVLLFVDLAGEPLKQLGQTCKELLPGAIATQDNRVVASLRGGIVSSLRWSMFNEEDPEVLARIFDELQSHFADMTKRYSNAKPVMFHLIALPLIYWHYMSAHLILAAHVTDEERKCELIESSIKIGTGALVDFKQKTGITFILGGLAECLLAKSFLVTAKDARKSILREALGYVEERLALQQRLYPGQFWDLAFSFFTLSSIHFHLSELEQDREMKSKLLFQANKAASKGMDLVKQFEVTKTYGTPSITRVSNWLEEKSKICAALFDLTGERRWLENKLDALLEANKLWTRLNVTNRIAESFWALGMTYSVLEDSEKAASNYEYASLYFMRESENDPRLHQYYSDYSSYMKCWSEIERAKNCHFKQECKESSSHFGRAAEILSKLSDWSYLSNYYLAWSKLEEAEYIGSSESGEPDLVSRKFEHALRSFEECHKELSEELEQSENVEKRKFLNSAIFAVPIRKRYCEARMLIEKSRAEYKEGNLRESGICYSSAEKILGQMLSEYDLGESQEREIKNLITMCRAWRMARQAEIESSSARYATAARIFAQISATAHNAAKQQVGAKGNSYYCMALAFTLRFRDSLKLREYSLAKSYLNRASQCFVKLGDTPNVRQIRAAERMIDAFMFLAQATEEIKDAQSRILTYLKAEKALKVCAEIYESSGHIAKRDEVKRLLESIEDEREFVRTLDVRYLSPSIQAGGDLSMKVPAFDRSRVQEQPAGLLEFEEANVQIICSVPKGSVTIGDMVSLEISLINIGKTEAMLHKIGNLRTDLLKLVEAPSDSGATYDKESGVVEFHDRVLPPQGTQSLNLKFSARKPGADELNPRITFSNAGGKLLTNTSVINIRIQPSAGAEFRNQRSKLLFDQLVGAFVSDTIKMKIPVESAGWRSLSELAHSMRVSPSVLYGRSKGQLGSALQEIISKGLAETRFSIGERGRGGEVLRVRVMHDSPVVTSLVELAR